MTVLLDEVDVQFILATIGFLSFVILFIARWRLSRQMPNRDMGRLLLIDALLVIAGVELVMDALDELGLADPWDSAAKALAFAARGALVAGAIALVATIKEAERTRRN